jgi:hypothetical protein
MSGFAFLQIIMVSQKAELHEYGLIDLNVDGLETRGTLCETIEKYLDLQENITQIGAR